MCNCGCNTCETKGPLLTEGKVKSLLSEGLQYHIDKKIPLFETVYRIGSDKHMSLIKEARKMYSRNIIDLCEEDEALIGTNLGEFALYEGESIPLDLPMLNESYDYDEVAQSEFGMDYDQLGSGEKEWVRDEIDNMSMNESDSNYPDFDLNKNIRYQDTSISSGMWRYTGKEQGGKGVYRNLNNGQILGFDRSDFDIFRNNLSSHFDISESINESKMPTQDQVDKFFALTQNEIHYLNSKPVMGQEKTFNKMEVEPWDEYDLSNWNALVRKAKSKGQVSENIYDKFLDNPSTPKGRAKSLILKFTKEYGDDASSMAVDRFASKNNLKPEEKYILKYITKNDIKISSQPGGPDFSALNESQAIITFKNDYEVKMNTGEGYDDDFEYFEAGEREQVYILDKNDKRVHVEFGDGTNAYIPTGLISIQDKSLNEDRKYNQEELLRLDLIARRRFDCDYEKCTDEQKAEVLKDKVKVGVKEALQEAKKKKKKEKKDPPLNKPKRGGSKAYYVYVRDPKTKKIKKVSFGSGGLRAKIRNPKARKAFAARHNCKNKKDRTKAGYWSCNLPRYAPALGLGAKMNTFW